MKWYFNQSSCMVEVWGFSETWKELHEVHRRFCKEVMGILNCAANGFDEMELGRQSRRSKCIGQTGFG